MTGSNLNNDTADLRNLIAEILDAFHPASDGHRARVSRLQIGKWRARAGIDTDQIATITQPDSTVITTPVTVSGDGTYSTTFVATQPGHYTWIINDPLNPPQHHSSG